MTAVAGGDSRPPQIHMLLMTEDAQPVLHCGICDPHILHPDLAMIAYLAGIRHGHLHRVTLSCSSIGPLFD